jgi:hypothetical protein
VNPLLDPRAAAEAGREHGQMASALAAGGLVLSAHKLVEVGARAQLLVAPGIFRFDARPEEDSLQVMTRSIGAVPPRWEAEENPVSGYGVQDPEGPYRATWRFTVDGDDPLEGRVQLLTTLDLQAGARHFALHAVVRERDRMTARST